MPPFIAQGAAQALEDGASVSACLALSSNVPSALAHYQKMRLERTSRGQALATNNKTRFHLPDGPSQKERDTKMATGGTDFSINPIAWVYGYDAATAVETGTLECRPARSAQRTFSCCGSRLWVKSVALSALQRLPL
jgi:salicylate hydroxylase